MRTVNPMHKQNAFQGFYYTCFK